MKNLLQNLLLILVVVTSFVITACSSNQGMDNYNIDQALTGMPSDVKQQLGDFKFYFGSSGGWTAKELGPVKTSLRTNAFAKNPQVSCNRVFYSALVSLKKQAEKLGGNAVANVQSNWKNNKVSSKSIFVCDNGVWMSGVALTGVAVKE